MSPATVHLTARQKARLAERRRRAWVRRAIWVIVWWIGAVTVGKLHLDSVRMYIVVTVLIGIFASLAPMRADDAVDSVCDEGDEKVSCNSVVNKDKGNPARVASAHNQLAVFTAMKALGTPQAIRAISDTTFRLRVMDCPAEALECCCGSGERFARCCRPLQEELRRCLLS